MIATSASTMIVTAIRRVKYFSSVAPKTGRKIGHREENRCGAQGEGKHQRRALEWIAGAQGQGDHRLRDSAGQQDGQGAHEERGEQSRSVLGDTAKITGESRRGLDDEIAENGMHVEHAQSRCPA